MQFVPYAAFPRRASGDVLLGCCPEQELCSQPWILICMYVEAAGAGVTLVDDATVASRDSQQRVGGKTLFPAGPSVESSSLFGPSQ
jgi:hypothetical protein